MRLFRHLLVLTACAVVVTGTPAPAGADAAARNQPDAPTAVAAAAGVTLPPVNGRFDYQIGGAYTPVSSVAIVDRDRADDPVPGRYNICYVNAFQTQPDEAAFWKQQHPDLLLRRGGTLVTDPGWPGEYLLDTSTDAKRQALAAIVGSWVDGCAADGFQAVEPDNLDSWTRSKKLLTKADNLAMSVLLADRAHAKGLAIAQKNTLQFGTAGRDTAHFDFAIAEECQRYDECVGYTKVFGSHVVEIEYTDYARSYYTRACAAQGTTISVILRDRDVVPSNRAAYRYEAC